MTKKKCQYRNRDEPYCKHPIVAIIRATLYHPLSNRHSKRMIHFCDEHMKLLTTTKLQGWSYWYSNKDVESPIVDYEILIS